VNKYAFLGFSSSILVLIILLTITGGGSVQNAFGSIEDSVDEIVESAEEESEEIREDAEDEVRDRDNEEDEEDEEDGDADSSVDNDSDDTSSDLKSGIEDNANEIKDNIAKDEGDDFPGLGGGFSAADDTNREGPTDIPFLTGGVGASPGDVPTAPIIMTFDEDFNNLSTGIGNEGNHIPFIVILDD
jgi:hypothetical protein